MSTRATYLFKGGEYRPDVCIYIHHDGYPEGAAHYFWNAFKASSGHLSAEDMIRGNERAEFTESHDLHGDTEYRYTLDGLELQVEGRQTLIEFGSYPDGWRTEFTGKWWDFVNKHAESEHWPIEDFEPIKGVDLGYNCTQAFTPKTLQAELDKELRLCGLWSMNGNGSGCNMDNLQKKITTMQSHLTKFGEPAWAAQS